MSETTRLRGHDGRRRLVAGLSGRVVEIGAGAGDTFAHYPAGVASVVAVEPDERRRAAAQRAARGAHAPIRVVDGVAERLPIRDGAVDAAVVSLVLCTVPDVAAALAELRRVLRPDGALRFLEHVVAERGPLRFLQRAAAPVYARLPDGCHIDRERLQASRAPVSRSRSALASCTPTARSSRRSPM